MSDVHELWLELMARGSDPEGLARACTQYESGAKISADEALDVLEGLSDPGPDAELDSEIDKNYFADLPSSSVKLSSSWHTILIAPLIIKMLFRN